MKSLSKKIAPPLLILSAMAPNAFADQAMVTSGVKDALAASKVNLDFRARYENVDQNGISNSADALTLKSRITIKTGNYNGLSIGVEVDNITALVEDYNSTQNGKSSYPVVADPEGTDVNQAYLQYKHNSFTATAGRQRINHNDQRFVGGVGWRQNEQTYDGYRLQYQVNDGLALDYSYIYNVNRIFGPTGVTADLKGALHLANAQFKMNKQHKFAAFAYVLDFDTAAALSTSTYGASYNGSFDNFLINASIASQSDNADHPNSFDAQYYHAEIGAKLGTVNLLAGVEVLGSDNGVGFSTPLATLHKFQGFVDKFSATPGNGINDVYVKASTKLGEVNVSATYHELTADEGSADYGNEIDLTAAYSFDKNYSLLVKYADYSADDFATDTSKLWLQLAAKF